MSAIDSHRLGKDDLNQILDEHEGLLTLLDALDDSLHRGVPQPQLQTALVELTDAIGAHFQSEEKLMAECGYTHLPAHRLEHGKILQDLRQVRTSSHDAVRREHFDAIKRKLTIHLQGKDRSMLQDLGGVEGDPD